ncbi:ATPase [Clostridium thermosuccinogenes]|jgi:vacuolar-type H+-ATPase subunit H|uniref:ATPase n=1 Tax=Clostridium thermosuccinogenes TaxID=84032 RepID=A0A2K2F323_9CLOT|nr:ATPase [Pseudoclostridium thermosuccinogenes]AUS96145.1 ATPase [Pseudoclostridium thermosuccinogenes]PNT93172.1 ATPase [Pseudoclostridium thermosuccinogenes]PNT98725.1 ATPase [Pseudoclostridium thermosuccinogenes]PNU00724.1 ATPase [Pseudoclostridium thermosuccinogenes]
MEILAILETLEDLIEKSVNVPVLGKCLVDKEEVLEIIKEIRLKLPDDIKQAKWVKEERQRILLEAQKEANNIVKEAENKIAALVDEHEITKRAYEQANEIIANAQKNARDIRLGTREYADSILNKVEEILRDTIDVIKSDREELK